MQPLLPKWWPWTFFNNMEEEQMPASKAQAAVAPITAAPCSEQLCQASDILASQHCRLVYICGESFQLRGIINVLAALPDTAVVLIYDLRETWP